MTPLVAVHQRRGDGDGAPWIVDGGTRVPGRDDNRRLAAVEAGVGRSRGVRTALADAAIEDVEHVVAQLHTAEYLATLRALDGDEPVVLPELAAPGMEPDIAVAPALVTAAYEGVRCAVTAARCVADGARYAYAISRPPGHHAGPAWLGGYCYLNTAAAAARTLLDRGAGPVGILDLDLHYPNGTSEIVARIEDIDLHSLHAWPVTNAPEDPVPEKSERERLVEFRTRPSEDAYVAAVTRSLDLLRERVGVLVLSLGYDTVATDPHGSWGFRPSTFARIGRAVAASGLVVCVIQEGGYALDLLADCSDAFTTGLLEGRTT